MERAPSIPEEITGSILGKWGNKRKNHTTREILVGETVQRMSYDPVWDKECNRGGRYNQDWMCGNGFNKARAGGGSRATIKSTRNIDIKVFLIARTPILEIGLGRRTPISQISADVWGDRSTHMRRRFRPGYKGRSGGKPRPNMNQYQGSS
jgi:hypothetical protein